MCNRKFKTFKQIPLTNIVDLIFLKSFLQFSLKYNLLFIPLRIIKSLQKSLLRNAHEKISKKICFRSFSVPKFRPFNSSMFKVIFSVKLHILLMKSSKLPLATTVNMNKKSAPPVEQVSLTSKLPSQGWMKPASDPDSTERENQTRNSSTFRKFYNKSDTSHYYCIRLLNNEDFFSHFEI